MFCFYIISFEEKNDYQEKFIAYKHAHARFLDNIYIYILLPYTSRNPL